MYEISCNWGQYIDIEEEPIIYHHYTPPIKNENTEKEYYIEELGYSKQNIYNYDKSHNDELYFIKISSQTILAVALAYLISLIR